MKNLLFPIFYLLFFASQLAAQNQDSLYVHQNYTKWERMIPMRDGVKLYTAIYIPKTAGQFPFMMERTPYSCEPYGENAYPTNFGPSKEFTKEQYIFVNQDVRGRYLSEGKFEEMTPHIVNKKTNQQTDESSDTYDTVEWLLKNVPNNNGRVGIVGISYPGFYASASLPDAHPAIKAVSPQAPVTDEFVGDDANHNGAFFLMDNFSFMNFFDYPREKPWTDYPIIFNLKIKDSYQFYLDLGGIKNANTLYYKEKSKIWNEYVTHSTYDAYWQARNIRPHLKDVKPAVLVVGGWFDAEDLFGALNTYKSIEQQSPNNNTRLIMGPWTHGGWARADWTKYATHDFGQNTAKYFQEIQLNFFNFYLKDKGTFNASEVTVFETGTNQWKSYDSWSPKNAETKKLYFQPNGVLSFEPPKAINSFDEYLADPNKPVPYMDTYQRGRNNDYMAADQRFASRRSDVMSYQSAILTEDITILGSHITDLSIATTGTDADFVVKLIDVLPDSTKNPTPNPKGIEMANFQRLVRAEVLRGKFRNSLEKPQPFVPNQATTVKYNLPDVAHTFKKGHRIMVQVQNSWFPLVDRNPQKFMNIPEANPTDFQKATFKIYHEAKRASGLVVQVLKP